MSLLRHSRPSPNHNARKAPPRLIVIHATAGGSDLGDVSWCRMDAEAMRKLWERTDPKKRPAKPWGPVSYHSIVARTGAVYDLVDPMRRAWACGVSSWQGVPNVNDYSLSLAFASRHDGVEALTEPQIRAAKEVIAEWRSQFPIEAVTTHAAIAPGRKLDPEKSPGFVLADYA